MDDPEPLRAWLKEAQDVELPAAQVREPAATALRLGALAGLAQTALPFGAEPAGFYVVLRRLARAGGDR